MLALRRAVEAGPGAGDGISPIEAAVAELSAQAADRRAGGTEHDDVSGLLRRPAAEPQLAPLLALARRLRLPLSLAVLAVDGFAALPDAERDPALATLGRAVRAALRPGDVGALWGAGEVVLGMLGDRRPRRPGRCPRGGRRAAPSRSGSAGIAQYPRDGETVTALVAAATAPAAGGERGRRPAGDGRPRPRAASRRSTSRWWRTTACSPSSSRRALQPAATPRAGSPTATRRRGCSAARGRRSRPRLVLLDWDLPARDGLTVLRGLAADGALAGPG